MSFYNVNDSFARDREQLRSGSALNGCYFLLWPGDIGALGGAKGACEEGSLCSSPAGDSVKERASSGSNSPRTQIGSLPPHKAVWRWGGDAN